MNEARHDSEPANPDGKDDPLQRIAVLERRIAVLTRENERLESFLAVLRHRLFGRSSEKMTAQPARHGGTCPGRSGRGGSRKHGHDPAAPARWPAPAARQPATREILPASTQCPCCSREMARIGQ